MIYEESDANHDGSIDEDELRLFLSQKRRDGTLQRDINLAPSLLIAKFDEKGGGTLSMTEFAALKDYVSDPMAADPSTNVRLMLSRQSEQVAAGDRSHVHLLHLQCTCAPCSRMPTTPCMCMIHAWQDKTLASPSEAIDRP